ncbi:MAG: erythromycin esterase family protein [Verrucomicrobia bacterium]|nr:erythromycin esterase family protein [Verrucomicrobiota bacterium]MCH8527103.1 erythromycin esterase family protein [Kiritimatiellia bacterium]
MRKRLLLLLIPLLHPAWSEDTAFIEALQSIARPLDEGMDPLVERLAESTLALMGEASHGTAEYYTLRGKISLRLIDEHGFRFVAVEGDWNAIHRLHRYVIGQTEPEGGAREIMGTFERWPQWMWANGEFADFVEALRTWNLKRPPEERAGLFGIDVYGMEDAVRALPDALEPVDPELAGHIREHLNCFLPYLEDMGAYARASRVGPLSPCGGAADAVLRRLTEHAEAHAEDWNAEDRLHALQMAGVIQSAERHYRAMGWGGAVSWNHRATHFFETARNLLDHYGPEARGIVWAHNTHIGDARATAMARSGQHNIGQLAREALGRDRVAALGFGTRQGTLLAGRQWGGTRQEMTKPPARPGTAEDLKHRAAPGDSVFFFGDAPEALDRKVGHRAAGVIYHPEREYPGNYVPTRLADRYDVFIFLETTTALTPLK